MTKATKATKGNEDKVDRRHFRPTIYLSVPLRRVRDQLGPGETLSARLSRIAERYALVTETDHGLDEDNLALLRQALAGESVGPLIIRHLPAELPRLLDHSRQAAGAAPISTEAVKALAECLDAMSLAERLSAVEAAEAGGGLTTSGEGKG